MIGGMKLTFLMVAVIGLLIGFAIKSSLAERSAWEEFASKHNCRVVGNQKGAAQMGISSSGSVVTVFEADKVGFLCDDGVTYWRTQ